MENENKNNPRHNQGERKNQHKPKSYYIEPKKAEDTAPEAKKSPEQTSQKPQEGNNKHHNKKHHHKNKRDGEKQSAAIPAREEQTAASVQQPTAQGQDVAPNHNKNRHKRRKKPKQDNNSTPVTQPTGDIQSAEKSASSGNESKAKKSYERPVTKKLPVEPAHIDQEEYEAVHFPSISEELQSSDKVTEKEDSPMVEVVGIRFKSSGKTYYFTPNGNTLKHGEHAIVETARGLEYGDVALGNTMVKESDTVPPLRPVIRAATPADVKRHDENKKKEDEAFVICNEKIIEHKLDMKLIDAQYTFDNSKLLFYFTSSGRVDFRDLVKDLAGVFRTRIELRQIGIRDEAKIMGGVGMCGRPLCCTLFLSDFGQVSIKMAKEQNLSLNCSKISGICGRLMCCLRYEHDTYEYEIKRTPPVDSLVQTADGTGTVTEISPLRGTVKVRLTASPENPPKVYRREDVIMLQKKAAKNNKQE